MEIVSARAFRANQTAILSKALKGESILLTSRIGTFKIMPVSETDSLTERIAEGVREAKLIEAGKLPVKTARDFLNEL
ncbi:MAG: type II toxin-antitoxin system prevent-host-death family antitoxin [Muribaculaceae bacterium]|nr:type II toxin-antitoxin system prevent-host-death family antitoxin [Muribaculaceae bacterium]MDE6683174.1 type II toxin-antitoxin system prevent-host-death family antitoxin [Muribaculaceae bacterium]